MLIDTKKEALEVLEKAVNKVDDAWEKNQAIDAINYITENTFDKNRMIDNVESISESLNEIKIEMGLSL